MKTDNIRTAIRTDINWDQSEESAWIIYWETGERSSFENSAFSKKEVRVCSTYYVPTIYCSVPPQSMQAHTSATQLARTSRASGRKRSQIAPNRFSGLSLWEIRCLAVSNFKVKTFVFRAWVKRGNQSSESLSPSFASSNLGHCRFVLQFRL